MPISEALSRVGVTASDFDRPVTCPAGVKIGERNGSPGCFCRIERSIITAHAAPSSLARYCMARVDPLAGEEGGGSHYACPTWRAQREADLAGRGELVPEDRAPLLAEAG